MQSAFHNLPIRPQDRKWLVMKAKNPEDGKFYYFVDKCFTFWGEYFMLPFSKGNLMLLSISLDIGLSLKLTIIWMTSLWRYSKQFCNGHVETFIEIRKEINFLLSMEKKRNGVTRIIVFLGMLLNTITQTISVPVDKKNKALRQLIEVITAKKVQVIQLQRLTGLLNFISRAIVPGRAFYKKDVHQICKHEAAAPSSGSRIWLRGGPKFLLAYIADIAKLSRMSEVSTSWPGVWGPP